MPAAASTSAAGTTSVRSVFVDVGVAMGTRGLSDAPGMGGNDREDVAPPSADQGAVGTCSSRPAQLVAGTAVEAAVQNTPAAVTPGHPRSNGTVVPLDRCAGTGPATAQGDPTRQEIPVANPPVPYSALARASGRARRLLTQRIVIDRRGACAGRDRDHALPDRRRR